MANSFLQNAQQTMGEFSNAVRAVSTVRNGLANLANSTVPMVLSYGPGDMAQNGPMMTFTQMKRVPQEYKTNDPNPTGSVVSRASSPGSTVNIALPQELAVNYSTQYEEVEIGAVLSAYESGGVGDGISAAMSAMAENFKKMAGEFTGVGNIQGLSQASRGKAVNPQMEMLFKNVNFRTFTFNFKFHPENAKESQRVKEIQTFFKTAMMPTKDGSGYFNYPDEFKIKYSNSKFYHNFATCVLTDMSVNYAPIGVVAQHADGAPVEIDMSLTFKEVEFLTRETVTSGDY